MTQRRITNMAASVRQRLADRAQRSGRPFQEVLQYFAMERFLYRLSQSPHADDFVLKGALMFTAWQLPATRPTMDIDLLGRTSNGVENLVSIIAEIGGQPVTDDGLVFDASTIAGRIIKEDADYEGVRVTFRGHLQNAVVPMQIDVGFGDVVVPASAWTVFPAMLDFEPLALRGYTRESVVAEKFEAMVKLGLFNSRMKDFYDIWVLSRGFDFVGPLLADAIARTLARRGTGIIIPPVALTVTFGNDASKIAQWQAFLRKSRLHNAPQDLAQVVEQLAAFLLPVATHIKECRAFAVQWKAPGPWTPADNSRFDPNLGT
jgi:hypothetical protein